MSAACPSPHDRDIAAIAARITRPVVLVGLMGVGKSTVGRKLAGMLGRDFVDADDAIVEGHGVIATGGGAFVDPQTRAAVLEEGIAVWIDCDVETLVERTSRRGNRPLLKTGDPKEILTRLAAERAPFYGQAHIRVRSENGPHADTARAIIEAIDQWL
jgi:shikimate kinase